MGDAYPKQLDLGTNMHANQAYVAESAIGLYCRKSRKNHPGGADTYMNNRKLCQSSNEDDRLQIHPGIPLDSGPGCGPGLPDLVHDHVCRGIRAFKTTAGKNRARTW